MHKSSIIYTKLINKLTMSPNAKLENTKVKVKISKATRERRQIS